MNMNNPYEENLQKPLEKYGRDITKAAKDGKVNKKLLDNTLNKNIYYKTSYFFIAKIYFQ